MDQEHHAFRGGRRVRFVVFLRWETGRNAQRSDKRCFPTINDLLLWQHQLWFARCGSHQHATPGGEYRTADRSRSGKYSSVYPILRAGLPRGYCSVGRTVSVYQLGTGIYTDRPDRFINRYAFSHIALYGKAYIPAAKDTWTMMKDRGIDALVNDCLIGPVLTMGSTFVGYLCAFLAYLYLEFTNPAYNAGGTYTPVIMAFAFLIGLQVCQIFMTPIGSGVDTIFVAAAWDPQVLMSDHPDIYSRMVSTYPKVQQVSLYFSSIFCSNWEHFWSLQPSSSSNRAEAIAFKFFVHLLQSNANSRFLQMIHA